jgi:hypothetical protein
VDRKIDENLIIEDLEKSFNGSEDDGGISDAINEMNIKK